MSINIIAAIGENNELGKNNKLIWRMPNDLKFFKMMTLDHTVVMGRKTFESLPNNLPRRSKVVLSSKNLDLYSDAICYKDPADILVDFEGQDIFIIGGESIYKLFLPVADNMYLTEIQETDPYADAYFPNFDKEEWNVINLENGVDNGHFYKRKKYVRKKNNNEW